MRKMKKHRLFEAEENFEDADTLSDLMSGQQFDLRHTIPGIPEVDYPIYSSVPKTSFECTGKHEGYYADIESRCQAFRICTHTARSVQGFGFLCPNGTLFSQKYFVCDWYRNVNCDDSERYYSKNEANSVGSNSDMMETVRQMMEYPMKTITKALQQNVTSNQKPAQRQRGNHREIQKLSTESKETNRNVERVNSSPRKSAVTRAQVESVHNRGSIKHAQAQQRKTMEHRNSVKKQETLEQTKTLENVATTVTTSSTSKTTEVTDSSNVIGSDNVYVNSLGELSTDPGVHFDRTNAHIIAEPSRTYRYEKNMNFAEKVNAALNDLADIPASETLAPDYVKSLRAKTQEAEAAKIDLAFNVNSLLDEVAYELDASNSGYQVKAPPKQKQSFRFLSRGFSNQNDPYKYQKPKQTASTVRFTPNELPNGEEKSDRKSSLNIANEAIPFENSKTQPIIVDDSTVVPHAEEDSYLSPPLEESDIHIDDNLHSVSESVPVQELDATTFPPTTVQSEQELYTVTPDTLTNAALEEATTSTVDINTTSTTTTTTTTDTPNTESPNSTSINISENLVLTQQQQAVNRKFNEDEVAEPIDEDRIDANKQAASLLLSGIQLTNNENNTGNAPNSLLIQVPEDHSYLTAWITSTSTPKTNADLTTTSSIEAPVETGSFQERIRNYRRLAGLQRATAKPLIYSKRSGLRMTTKTTTTTPRSTITTQSYLKRVAANRLRLSRLHASASVSKSPLTTPASLLPIDNALDTPIDKKLSIRNIDKETANAGHANAIPIDNDPKSNGIVTWESVRNSLQRYQTDRKSNGYHNKDVIATPTEATTTIKPVAARDSLMRVRPRFGNLKMPTRNLESNKETVIKPTPKTSISTSVSMSVTSTSSSHGSAAPSSTNFHNLNSPISSLFPPSSSSSSSVVVPNSNTQNTLNTATSSLTAIPTTTLEHHAAVAENTNLNSNSASASTQQSPTQSSATFISFDKLTRSIVDDSILQNYRAGPTLGRSSLPSLSTTNFNGFQTSPRIGKNQLINTSQVRTTKSPTIVPSSHLPEFTVSPFVSTTPGPRIVIARAEGQRIEPNSVSSIISSLITQQQQQKPQPKPTPASSYVPLNDFLSKKFGNEIIPASISSTATSTFIKQQPTQNQQQQQHAQSQQHQHSQNYQQSRITSSSIGQQYQQQQNHQQHSQTQQQFYRSPQQVQYESQQTQRQQQILSNQQSNFFQTQVTQQPTNYAIQNQQRPLINPPRSFNQLSPPTSTQQSLNTQNVFTDFQQQDLQQLPQFPPLAPPQQFQQQSLSSSSLSPSTSTQFNDGVNYLNIQLPSLANGLIPAPNGQTAQRRNDFVGTNGLELMDITPSRSVIPGATSYDVPLNSIGRLPNDMQAARLRRQRRI